MNFRPELAVLVMDGEKTVTRRLTSTNPRSPWWEGGCKYRIGQGVAVCPGRAKHAIGRAVVTDVRLERLGHLSHEDARAEGFADVRAFEAGFAAINGKYNANAKVWRIGLRAVEELT